MNTAIGMGLQRGFQLSPPAILRQHPLDPPRRGALAPGQRHRPAVHHPAQKRSPLLPLHPLPRPGPRPRVVPLGEPEHHHRRFPPPASATSTTPPAAPGCSCTANRKPAATCASNASRMAAPVPPPNPSCVWGLRPTKATKASGSCSSTSGDPLAAGAGDPGGVAAGDGVGGLRGHSGAASVLP
jgi:hypothetical protein